MTLVIEFYFIVCVSLLLFDIAFLLLRNNNIRVIKYHLSKFEKDLNEEIQNFQKNGVFSEAFQDSLTKKLSVTKNLVILTKAMEKYPEIKSFFRPYVSYELNNYQKKSDYEQAFYAYVVSIFDYSQEKVRPSFATKMLHFLDSKSLYTFSNTMEALYAFGDEQILLLALNKIDERQGFYHKKLLVDGLLSAKVNFQTFNPQLVSSFHTYSPFLQDSLLDFFRMNHYDVTDLCLQLLYEPELDSEVRYNAMRYFSRFPTLASKKYFMQLLQTPDTLWIEQLLAIHALENYMNDPDIINIMWKKVTNPKWYIRTNAIHFLYTHGMEKSDVFALLRLRDQYAMEALLYEFRNNSAMTNYILETVDHLKQIDQTIASHAINVRGE